ncbi:MAG: TrbC/VirB2 family protein [Betaproteobacteria bacterium]|jgi:type IV secretory pathway VirB2 component (pilin)|nr:TrbC/VirB2 family protein [Betaproteobacteria bacterium]
MIRSLLPLSSQTPMQREAALKQARALAHFGIVFILVSASFLIAPDAAAQDMPWIAGFCKLGKLITGPVAGALSIIILAVMGLAYAAGEEKSVMGSGTRILIGISIAFFAASAVEYFSGGTVSGYLCK